MVLNKFLIFSVLFLGYFSRIEAACSSHQTCGDCAGQKDFLFHCEWCVSSNTCFSPVSGSCSDEGTIVASFDCPMDPDSAYAYSDDFARNTILPLVGGSFSDNALQVQACLDTHFNGDVKATKLYTIVCDKDNNTCSAYLAVDAKNKAIILVFAGTKGASQLLDEGSDFLRNAMADFPEVGGKIDKYYHTAYFILWNSANIFNDLKALTAQYPGYSFWTAGHSMGGSFASIASAHVIKLGMFPASKVKMVSFGQPRTGDMDYAVAHDNLVKYRYRVIHNHDSVPHLPYQTNPTDQPTHHRFEVWYPNNMYIGAPYSICDRADDKSCSNAVKDDSTDDHLHYFSYNLPEWYKTQCKL